MLENYKVLVVDDREDHAYACSLMVRSLGGDAAIVHSGPEALEALDEGHYDIALIDYMMPEMDGMQLLREIKQRDRSVQVVMITAFGTIPSAIEAVKVGAYDYVTKPFTLPDLERVIRSLIEERGEVLDGHRRLREARVEGRLGDIVGSSAEMQEIIEVVRKAGPTDATILIQGESGTGKELIARAVHDASTRRDGPFVTVDCGSINPNLIQSELFGHTRGAFTGATSAKPGLILTADGGTLFLDEVGELPLETQTQLLRAIQEKTIRPVGSNAYKTVDVRFLSATNKDLEAAVKAGTFREDLYYRLHVVQLRVPALRERAGDVPVLAEHLLARLAPGRAGELRIDAEASAKLKVYPWPGNVRELENVLERALALGAGSVIGVADLPRHLVEASGGEPLVEDEDLSIEHLEREAIERALQRTEGDKAAAAKLLHIDRSTLYRKIRRYGIGAK